MVLTRRIWPKAVSYTHLDVYKRQPCDYGTITYDKKVDTNLGVGSFITLVNGKTGEMCIRDSAYPGGGGAGAGRRGSCGLRHRRKQV